MPVRTISSVTPVFVVVSSRLMQVPVVEARASLTALPPQLAAPSVPEGHRRPKLPGDRLPPPPWWNSSICRPSSEAISTGNCRSVLPAPSDGLHMNIGGILQTTWSLPATAAAEVLAVPGPPTIWTRMLVIVRDPRWTSMKRASVSTVVRCFASIGSSSASGRLLRKRMHGATGGSAQGVASIRTCLPPPSVAKV